MTAPVVVQASTLQYSTTAGTGVTLSLPNTAAGNAILLLVNGSNAYPNAGATITDAINGAAQYTLMYTGIENNYNNYWSQVHLCTVGKGGTLSINVKNAGGDCISAVALEVSGLSGVKDISVNKNCSAVPGSETLASGVLAQADELLVSTLCCRTSAAISMAVPTGWSGAVNNGGANYGAPVSAVAWKPVSSTASQSVTYVSTGATNDQMLGLTSIVTLKAGAVAPRINSTDVNIVNRGGTVTINGTSFTGSDTVMLGGVSQNVSQDTATQIKFSANRGTNKYGVALDLTVVNANGTSNAVQVALQPQSGWSYVDVSQPATPSSGRLTSTPTDIAAGDQIAYDNKLGSVTVNPDGTFVADPSVSSFQYEVWTPSVWGTTGTETIGTGSINGSVVVHPAAQAVLTTSKPLRGAAVVTPSVTGKLGTKSSIFGSVVVSPQVRGTLTTKKTLKGDAKAQASVSGQLQAYTAISGSARCTASAKATMANFFVPSPGRTYVINPQTRTYQI